MHGGDKSAKLDRVNRNIGEKLGKGQGMKNTASGP